jgi:uncharacterized protein with FMN-binding domain
MRRAVLTLGTTAAGLAALLSFKIHSAAPVAGTSAASSTSSTATAAGGAGGATPAASVTRSAKSAPSARSASSRSASSRSASSRSASSGGAAPAQTSQARHTSAPTAQTRTVTGAVANTQYGPMQVQLTFTGTQISKATVLQRTDDGAESNQIDSFAIPKLESETLAAQSASIDAVSGASYTSSGYIQSLQSALDQARA